MAGWHAFLLIVGMAIGAILTARRGVLEYLFLDFRRDERPMEFWLALLVITTGAIGVLYVLLV
jgi:hypothetical protein